MKKRELIRKIVYGSLFLILLGIFIYLFYSDSTFSEILNLGELVSKITMLFPKIIVLVMMFLFFKLISIFFVESFIGRFMEAFETRARIKSIKKIIGFFLWVIYILLGLFILFGNFGALLTSLGLVGLGLTFALQKPILNFVGWMTIILKNIYNPNDRIRIGTVYGDVKEVQMMNTVLYALLGDSNSRSHTIITVPNELVLTQEVENFTKDSNYVMTTLKISTTYESDIQRSMQLLEGIVKTYLKENVGDYKKWEKRKGSLKKIIDSLFSNRTTKKLNEKASEEKEVEEIRKELMPSLRVELADSSVDLIAFFLVPYEKVGSARTFVNKEFLEKSKKEKNISIAYPHLEIIQKK